MAPASCPLAFAAERTGGLAGRIKDGGKLVSVPTDEELLAEHIAGQPGRFEQLVRRHSEELFRFLARFAGNDALAEDLVQESFLQVYRSAEGFDFGRRFRPWLYTIAANKARDIMRSRRRRGEVPLDAQLDAAEAEGQKYLDFLADTSPTPADNLEQAEVQARVRKVLTDMPDNLREVLILSYYHRFPYKEIADVLDIPLGTVKSRLHAAVGQFGQAYREATENESEAQ